MTNKITPSIKRTLAYVYAFGWMPSHIHASTYCKVRDMCSDKSLYRSERYLDVRDEFLHHIANETLKLAHDYLISQGFIVDRGNRSFRRTSHYIRYHRLNDDGTEDTATSYRSGDYLHIYPHGSYRARQVITLEGAKP